MSGGGSYSTVVGIEKVGLSLAHKKLLYISFDGIQKEKLIFLWYHDSDVVSWGTFRNHVQRL